MKMKMKHLTGLALALAIAGGAVPSVQNGGAPLGMQAAHAQSAITVLLNGRVLSLGAAGATQQSGRVLVPLRSVFEALGATVDFDNQTQTVFATRADTQMQLRIGSTQANVNGQVRVLDVPAKTLFGRTLVPLRFVSEALGASVSWNEAQRTVYITTANTGGTTTPPDYTPPVAPPVTPPVTQQRQTINGSVVRVGTSGYDFVLGLPDATTFTVRTTQLLPTSLSVADVVRITGVRGTEFAADDLTITSDVTARRGRGEVVGVRNRQLSVRLASGEVLAVQLRDGNRLFAVGDRVRFDGFDDGALIRYSQVFAVANGDNSTDITPPAAGATNVDFAGVVETVDTARNQLRVRGDNGQLYTVNYNGADTIQRYQRVRVQGSFAGGVTTANTITVVE